MLRLLAAIAALVAAVPASANERRYALPDFDRILVEGPFIVRVTTGRSTSAAAEGSREALEALSVEVQGTTLRIRRLRAALTGAPVRAVEPATITLTTRSLRVGRVLGSGQLEISGLAGQRIDLGVDGTGRLRASGIAADNLFVSLLGSGTLELAGTAETFSAGLQGSGSLLAPGLSVETATVTAVTTGDIAFTARRAATINANSLGQVTVGGTPACTVRGPGASEVRCGTGR